MYTVLDVSLLAPDTARLWVEAPHVARKRRPGQFVIVRVDEDGERIPLTIADADPARGAIALVVQAVGKTTRMINALRPGDALRDVAGPLGTPTHITPGTRLCCVGGGIGTAVVYPIAAAAARDGCDVVAIIGGRTADLVILEPELRAVARECLVTTDDGSRGRKGLVTDALHALIERGERFDRVLAVGPLRMMEAVCDLTRVANIPTLVSLNPVMVDGTGMCGGCRVTVAGEPKFACVDGPEFDGHQVDFGELAARLGAYREQEAIASARQVEQAAAEAAARFA